ncbi:MAG: hypothetical protein ABUL62_13965 [Myxococcales bacterium]|jgi:hypothetical protein
MPASDHSAFSSRSPFARAWFVLPHWLGSRARALTLAGAAAAFALGCTPKIGDSCTVSTNCSATGDRLCDITQPGGYCTVFNCEPYTCPEDSACINFGSTLSSVAPALCSPGQGTSPYQRSFCMAKCGSDGDCRGGYSCLNLKGDVPNVLGAVLVEYAGDGKVCAVSPHQAPELAASNGGGAGYVGVDTAVCDGYTGGATSGGASAGGASSSGAAGALDDAGAGGN